MVTMSSTLLAEVVVLSLEDFLMIRAAPGHRDSEGRAVRAEHLHTLIPEHCQVEIAEYTAASGEVVRESMTGNTRRQVWKCGLSDRVPEQVRALVYRMKDADEVRKRLLFHDSREAAWTARDHMARAHNMTFGEGYRPRSKALKNGTYLTAIRNVDCLVADGRATPDRSVQVELIMRNWAEEIKSLDAIVDTSIADTVRDKKPFTWGFFAACLLLLKFSPYESVETFIHGVLNDAGTKTEDGLDGIYVATENLNRNAKEQDQVFRGILGSFDLWEQRLRGTAARSRKVDPLTWVRKQRENKREREKAIGAA